MMLWLIVAAVYLAGCVATNAVTRQMGRANPNTIGDYFSGDDVLDLAVIVLWPAFWPLWAVHRAAEGAYRAAKG